MEGRCGAAGTQEVLGAGRCVEPCSLYCNSLLFFIPGRLAPFLRMLVILQYYKRYAGRRVLGMAAKRSGPI